MASPYINNYGGYLLRVKPAVADEGGVAAGYAVLSSPELV
jgi:glutathione synthase